MLVDFRTINVKDIDGTESPVDISKELATILYRSAITMTALDLAKELYKEGQIEINEEAAVAIIKIVETSFLAAIQEAVIPVLESIGKENE